MKNEIQTNAVREREKQGEATSF